MSQRRLNGCFSTFCRWLPVAVAFFSFAVLPGVSRAADYPSLYGYGQTTKYCSADPCGGASNCEESFMCDDALPYRYTEKIVGFRDLYDFNDPKILCAEDHSGIEGCAPAETKNLQLDLTTFGNYYYDYVHSFPDAFRIFIPAGTVRGNITILMPLDEDIGFAIRYGQPPAATSFSSYGAVPWDATGDANLETMAQRDVYLQNGGGATAVLSTFVKSQPMSATEAGWLYIRKIPFSGSVLHIIKVKFKVDVAAYRDWYNGVMWEANGDPTAEAACTEAGLCDGELHCAGSGFYWYNDECHAEPKCRADNLVGCMETEECCGLVDENGNRVAYWYDGSCYGEPICTADDISCGTQADCEDGSGLFWYENGSGDPVCNSELACDRDSLGDCDSQLKCESAGFYWNGNECLTSAGTTTTTSSSSSTTSSYYSSGSSYSSSYTSSSSSSSSTSSSSGNSFSLAALLGLSTPASTPQCSSENLELCNQGECEALGSGYWYDGSQCRERGNHEYYGSPGEAPVCSGNGGDGSLNASESFILKANLAAETTCYGLIMFPNNDYLFIGGGNQEMPFSDQLVPIMRDGVLFQHSDLCAALPEDYQGEWELVYLTVPVTRGTFVNLESLADYLNLEDAQYIMGSTTITVDCSRGDNNIAAVFQNFVQ